jgi:predicted extracellular nuclease
MWNEIKTSYLLRLPASERSGPEGDTVITTFNVENLFDLKVSSPGGGDERSMPTSERIEIKLSKLALAIRLELRRPEIIIIQEAGSTEILQNLGDRVNAAVGTAYVATSFKTSDKRGLEVGFLWDSSRVELIDAFQLSGPEVESAFGHGSPSPGREPLVGVFKIKGRRLTIIGNHFKSMLGDDPLPGPNGQATSITEAQRKAQARVVRNFVNSVLDNDHGALIMIAGDLNDGQFEKSNGNAGYPVAILEGAEGEVPLTNLITMREKKGDVFTFVYDIRAQMLDHMLVSPALLKLFVAVDILHFNAGFALEFSEDASTTRRASDHDPLEGRFSFKENQ